MRDGCAEESVHERESERAEGQRQGSKNERKKQESRETESVRERGGQRQMKNGEGM